MENWCWMKVGMDIKPLIRFRLWKLELGALFLVTFGSQGCVWCFLRIVSWLLAFFDMNCLTWLGYWVKIRVVGQLPTPSEIANFGKRDQQNDVVKGFKFLGRDRLAINFPKS